MDKRLRSYGQKIQQHWVAIGVVAIVLAVDLDLVNTTK